MSEFAGWLSRTSISLAIQSHEWVIPTVQSLHIIAVAGVLGSVFIMMLRILGWAGPDQTLAQTTARFGPWLSWALCALMVTGAVMIVGEPMRQLLALSFWLKMGLVVIGIAVAVLFQRSLHRRESHWESVLIHQSRVKGLAVVTFLVWVSVVVLGRLIAYDYVWGSWSTALKQ